MAGIAFDEICELLRVLKLSRVVGLGLGFLLAVSDILERAMRLDGLGLVASS